jgi:hypothetical protein
MKRRVLLAGEGKTELGGWAGHPAYAGHPVDRAKRPAPGILEALLAKIAPDGWEVVAAYEWKSLIRYRANEPGVQKDELNTRALRVRAGDHGCDLIAFSRDRDRAQQRDKAVTHGLAQLEEGCLQAGIRVVGGLAHQCSEAWVLAVLGEPRSEDFASPTAKQQLRARGVADITGMVQVIEAGDLARLPGDAYSLQAWLARARVALAAT